MKTFCKTMPISVELPLFSISRVSLCPFASECVFYNSFFGYQRFDKKLNCNSVPYRRISMRVARDVSSLNGYESGEGKLGIGEFRGDSEVVEVIGIGSRKDAIIDFCLDSPFQSASLRFWSILMKDSVDVQLQEKFLRKDLTPKILDSSQFIQSSSKAIILVASAGYGLDHIAAIDILKKIRSANGFAVAIVLKPFSFEGRRRLDEVKDLIGKLWDHTNFCIDVDTDMLLKKDLVTLDEALKTANNAVLLAINAISALTSEIHKKFVHATDGNAKELKVSEVLKVIIQDNNL